MVRGHFDPITADSVVSIIQNLGSTKFLQQPTTNGHQSVSGEILGTMEQLQVQMSNDQKAKREDEAESAANFNALRQDKEALIGQNQDKLDADEKILAEYSEVYLFFT